MSSTEALPVVWVVDARTAELDQVMRAPGSGIRRMRLLPLVIVPPDHPHALDPPKGCAVSPLARADDLNIAWAIDRFLWESDAFRERAPGGNDWVATPTYPHLDNSDGSLAVEMVNLPAVSRAYPTSLSLSPQLAPQRELDQRSPLAIATLEAARRMPVFVAVGKLASLPEDAGAHDLRSPLARLPWVIPIDESSSATPRTASVAALITAFLLQVQAAMEAVHTGTPHGVPLLLMGYIDQGFTGFDPAQKQNHPMIPFGFGISEAACREATTTALAQGVKLTLGPNPMLVASLLRKAAPAPGGPHEGVAVTVSYASVTSMLAALTWRTAFGLAGHDLPEDAVFDTTMADAGTLSSLFSFAMNTRLVYGIDYRRRWLGSTVRPPSMV